MTTKKNRLAGRYWDKPLVLVDGCSPVSEGCDHCWAAAAAAMRERQANPKIAARYQGLTNLKGAFNSVVRTSLEPLEASRRRKVPTTYAVWNDLFHTLVAPDFIDAALDAMTAQPWHEFLILTKRPIMAWLHLFDRLPVAHLRFGATAETQARLEERASYIGHLQTMGWPTYLSLEPLLGPIDLAVTGDYRPDWVILGGETGRGARPMQAAWVDAIMEHCQAREIPVYFKSWGARPPAGQRGRLWRGSEYLQMP